MRGENLSKEYVHLSIISFESNSFRDQMEKFTDRFVKIMFVCKFIYLINRNEAYLNELRFATYEIPFWFHQQNERLKERERGRKEKERDR